MKIAIAAFIALAGITSSAIAGTIVDTGSPSSYTGGYIVGGISSNQSLYGLFTSTEDSITSIRGLIGNNHSTQLPERVTASLYNDAGGSLGSLIDSISFDVPYDAFEQSFYGQDGLNFSVVKGQNYWVGFSALADGASLLYMPFNVPNPLIGYGARNDGNGQTFTRIDNLNFGVRILGTSAAAVPEPATWAMMIGGFGLVGGTLRRRARPALRAA